MPVLDYPNDDGDVDLYDEEWRGTELAVLEEWVDTGGGWLVVANSGHRLQFSNFPRERNEDWGSVNYLAQRFGLAYVDGPQPGDQAEVSSDVVGGLMTGVQTLWLAHDNAVPMMLPDDAVQIASWDGHSAVAVFRCGVGGVIALADIGILGDSFAEGDNRIFWQNLAEWVLEPP